MKKLTLLLVYFTLMTSCLNPLFSQEAENTYTEEFSPAYQETRQSGHWSAYVPLIAIVASAAFFGWADMQSTSSSSSKSRSYSAHCGSHSGSYSSSHCSCRY